MNDGIASSRGENSNSKLGLEQSLALQSYFCFMSKRSLYMANFAIYTMSTIV